LFNKITHSQFLKNPIQKIPFPAELKLQPGEIFKGTVIQKYPGGGVLVAFKGKEFPAFTELNLTEGQKHHFQVKSTGQRIELKVLDGGVIKLRSPLHIWASSRTARDQLAGILKELAGARNLKGLSPEATAAFKSLSQLLPALVYSEPGGDDARWFSRFLLGSGLFWENKVARHLLGEKNKSWKKVLATDLKGILLSLNKSMKAEGHDQPHLESLVLKIKQAIDLIEQNQFLNLSSIREGAGFFFFVPGLADEGFKKAEVFVKNDEKENGLHLTLFLEFTRLGQMEVAVSVVESVISVKILVQDDETAKFITENLPLLEAGLQDEGMTIGTIFCDIKEKQGFEMTPFSDGKIPTPSIHLVI